jgi:hypothetical protein
MSEAAEASVHNHQHDKMEKFKTGLIMYIRPDILTVQAMKNNVT